MRRAGKRTASVAKKPIFMYAPVTQRSGSGWKHIMAARVKWLPSVQRRFWRRFCTETPAAFLSRRCDSTAFGICECANPFQVFILPRLFKFSVLTFFNRNFRSHTASICRMLRLVDVRGVPFTPKSRNKKNAFLH